MNTIPSHYKVVLSNHPHKVTVGDIQLRLQQNDEAAKNYMVDFIYHRLNHRYIEPLKNIPNKPIDYKSGFLIMAVSCLLIEALYQFLEGEPDTRGKSESAFKDFFRSEAKHFPGFTDARVNFYGNIRCGILHQAETKGGFCISRDDSHPLLDIDNKRINANRFLEAVEASLNDYISKLKVDAKLWDKAVDKLNFICDNCKA